MRSVIGELGSDAGDVTIIDLEASIEHLSRGTIRHVDALLVVTEPYYRSLETAGRTIPLAVDLGIERISVVGNKVRTEREEAAIREYCARQGFDLRAIVPFDENVTEADLQGRALIDVAPGAPAVRAIEELASDVLSRLGGTLK